MEKKTRIITRQISSDFEEKLMGLADKCRESGDIQVLLVAMTSVIQREMTHYQNRDQLPHASAVDNIMRAVEQTLRGDPNENRYVLKKLEHGHNCLRSWMNSSPDSQAKKRCQLDEYFPAGAPH